MNGNLRLSDWNPPSQANGEDWLCFGKDGDETIDECRDMAKC